MSRVKRTILVEQLYLEYQQKIKSGVSRAKALTDLDYLHPTILSMLVSRIKKGARAGDSDSV